MRLILLGLLMPLLSCAMENSETSAKIQQNEVREAYSILPLSLGFAINGYKFSSELLRAEQLEEKYAQNLSTSFYKVLYRNEIIYLLGQAQAELAMTDQVLSSQIDSKLKIIASHGPLHSTDIKALFESLSVERIACGQAKSNLICVQQLSKRISKKAGL